MNITCYAYQQKAPKIAFDSPTKRSVSFAPILLPCYWRCADRVYASEGFPEV